MRPEAVREHEARLGRSVETVMEFLPYESWSAFERPTTQLEAWAGTPYDVVFTTPMIPSDGSTLAAGATGAYDAHWRTFAQTMIDGGRPNAIIRLGHEFNHTFYPWSASGGQEAVFADYFRHIVTVLRSVPGARFRITFNVLSGVGTADVVKAYPGDSYVDYIGLDIYDDVYNVTDFEQRWTRLRTQAYGIDWVTRFASEHDKPIAFDEWALVLSTDHAKRDPATDSGDDVVYIDRMLDLFEKESVAYACYFDVSTAYGSTNSRIMNGPYPNATALYHRRLRGDG
jgi:beta-mannanase